MKRAQIDHIYKDLKKKIGLIVGPRQVGKTYLSQQIAKKFEHPLYLNYDSIVDKKIIEKLAWLPKTDLLILDEIHKMPLWKNYLKGLFDTKENHLRIIVTGSARLEIFNQIGDSLAGRYFLHRLMPFSPAELHQIGAPIHFETLMQEGGFPEPYLAKNKSNAHRWRLQYSNSMLSTDVFDFNMIQNIRSLRTLFELLRTKIGAPISYQSLAEDVAIAPNTVKKYIDILEALFIIFRLTPFSKNIARSLLKEPKIYFFDNGLVKGDSGARLENLVAVCLLKHVYALTDYQGENHALHYLRTKEGREVNFALVKDDKVEQIIEVKQSDSDINASLYFFHQKYNLPAIQIVNHLKHEHLEKGIKVVRAQDFLSELAL